MPPRTSRNGSPSRFRLPGIEHVGYAQLSLIETALSPLDPSLIDKKFLATQFQYTDETGERRGADVQVGYAFEPLLANDDFILWSLLSLTLRYADNHVLTATPYWLLKNLGMTTGGDQYLILRRAVERLAAVVYHNSGFYNLLTQKHERWTFAFFASHLPQSLDSDRLWRLRWNEEFIAACRATGGRMMFDLELFRKLGSPATRRLFLKLTDRFWRTNRVHLDVNDLTINGLGNSPTVPLKVRKQKLTRCIETLVSHELVTLGKGHATPKDLYLKRGKGSYVVVFFRGPYFEQPHTESPAKAAAADPLYGPIKALGVDEPMIAKLFANCSRGLLERWLRITEAAIKEKPEGFPGFKVSPAAFFVDGVLNERMPPDWMYRFEKLARQRVLAAETAKLEISEQLLRHEYDQRRLESLKAFLKTETGRKLYEVADGARLAFNLAQGHPAPVAERYAASEAGEWVDRQDEFAFPEFPVWSLARQAEVS